MTDDQMRDLVKECDLDWQKGYMRMFDDDPTNRYAVLIEAAQAAERERWTDVVAHAVSELEAIDDETAQCQAESLRWLLPPNK